MYVSGRRWNKSKSNCLTPKVYCVHLGITYIHIPSPPTSMKVSPLLPQTSAKKQAEDVPLRDDSEAANNCLKRRRLHSQTNIIINGHYRHHSKHHYPRHDDNKSSSMDCFDTISNSVNGNSNSSCNSSNSGEDASDCDDSPARSNSHPKQQYPDGGTSAAPSPAHNNHKKKVRYFLRYVVVMYNNNNNNIDNDNIRCVGERWYIACCIYFTP
jgi:hypothetical protein